MSELRYEVLVNDGLRRNRDQRLPDGSPIISSPVASTLIYGERDAVLVDPPFTHEQVSRVGDWIERSGKHLTAVYATHGHGDHWFGTDLLLQRFPDAVAYATDGTIAMMHEQGTVGRAQLWDVDFPGLIPPSPVVYQPIPVDGIELEGHRLIAVEVGHTDTDDTTVLHVPSIGLVVAGDVAYNGVHQYLLESAARRRRSVARGAGQGRGAAAPCGGGGPQEQRPARRSGHHRPDPPVPAGRSPTAR